MPFGSLLSGFLWNRDAGVAPIMALAALPLFGMVGAAVDYSRAASARTAMQAALDASALMLSKDAQTLSTANLTQKASEDFKTIFNRPEAYNIQVDSQFTQPAQGTSR
jgi:Flp pilus assembly protein TadG